MYLCVCLYDVFSSRRQARLRGAWWNNNDIINNSINNKGNNNKLKVKVWPRYHNIITTTTPVS